MVQDLNGKLKTKLSQVLSYHSSKFFIIIFAQVKNLKKSIIQNVFEFIVQIIALQSKSLGLLINCNAKNAEF